MKIFQGIKTKAAGVGLIVGGILGLVTGTVDPLTAGGTIYAGVTTIFMRNGIAKAENAAKASTAAAQELLIKLGKVLEVAQQTRTAAVQVQEATEAVQTITSQVPPVQLHPDQLQSVVDQLKGVLINGNLLPPR